MTNEEAFENWYKLHGDGASYYRDKLVWQAAIAYMQGLSEFVSEPVYLATDGECNWYEISEKRYKEILSDDDKRILYTTPQRQQPLKRLSGDQIDELMRGDNGFCSEEFANAIMDKMQEINRE